MPLNPFQLSRLARAEIVVQDYPAAFTGKDPALLGVLAAIPDDEADDEGEGGRGEVGYYLVPRPGLSLPETERLTAYALTRCARYAQHGPEPDGWHPRADGGHEVWVRSVELAPMD